ncbi:hypothetical protein K493DRAFT_338637 [Basidiobolus meristosporus CBS 931.73]|uniref:Myb-like domain-containing protein n=1 Tax=Basidiobolus meristosporus CBS 931.73 TaxID=1314790 RepID=A0A1Y1Y474_9FUNG|nr:hypothetical protein K493DRAFT_338637 [Basidiobolus meristosporus CBS 931.73]|eukprot:ORX92783.1 hypothetical protein K493DRAFT_338637 [Basidiobolus meristosporus CBS 931.73]
MSTLNNGISTAVEPTTSLSTHTQPHPLETLQTAVAPITAESFADLAVAPIFPHGEITLAEADVESVKQVEEFANEAVQDIVESHAIVQEVESVQAQVTQALNAQSLVSLEEDAQQLREMQALQSQSLPQQEMSEVIQSTPHHESVQKMDYSLTPVSTVEENSPTREASTPSYMVKSVKERELSVSSKRERSENWQHSETKLLLKLWEKYYNELKKYKRNSTVWDRIAEELRAAGFDRNAAQCKSRVRVLMAKYKACLIDDVEDPEAVESFDYYKDLKRLVSGNFTHIGTPEQKDSKSSSPNPFNMMRGSNGALTLGDDSMIDEDEHEHESAISHTPKKRKMVDQLCELVTYLIQRDEKRSKEREEQLQIRQQKHEAKLKERAERIQRREERARARELEMQSVFGTQLELMKSLIETISNQEI